MPSPATGGILREPKVRLASRVLWTLPRITISVSYPGAAAGSAVRRSGRDGRRGPVPASELVDPYRSGLRGNGDVLLTRRSERGSVLALVPAAFLVLVILGALAVDSAAAYLAQRQLRDSLSAAAADAVGAGLSRSSFYATVAVTLVPAAGCPGGLSERRGAGRR